MQKYPCPSCGAEVVFQTSIFVSAVCPYCRSLIVRHDRNLEAMGTMAELPADLSPLQIGTGGTYKGMHFGIIGRIKVGWEDGCWNEWFLYLDNGLRAWLAEAQGALAFITELDITEQDKKAGYATTTPMVKNKLTLHGKSYTVSDVKRTQCIGTEGELPFFAPKGREIIAVDLSNEIGEFAGIEIEEGKSFSLFTGEYVEFDDLKFTNLRELPGWKMPRKTGGSA